MKRIKHKLKDKFNNRSKNSLTSIGEGMNCTFEHVVTVHSVLSNTLHDAQILC